MLLTVMQHYRMVGLYEKGPMLPWFLSHFDNEIRIMSPQLHAHLVRYYRLCLYLILLVEVGEN